MKKVFQKAFLFVATMTLSLGFASCSDDDDPVTEGNVVPATELGKFSIEVQKSEGVSGLIIYT